MRGRPRTCWSGTNPAPAVTLAPTLPVTIVQNLLSWDLRFVLGERYHRSVPVAMLSSWPSARPLAPDAIRIKDHSRVSFSRIGFPAHAPCMCAKRGLPEKDI